MCQIADGHSDELIPFVPERLTERVVCSAYGLVIYGDDGHPDRRQIEYGLQTKLTIPQSGFGPLSSREVQQGGDHPRNTSSGVPQQAFVYLQKNLLRIRPRVDTRVNLRPSQSSHLRQKAS